MRSDFAARGGDPSAQTTEPRDPDARLPSRRSRSGQGHPKPTASNAVPKRTVTRLALERSFDDIAGPETRALELATPEDRAAVSRGANVDEPPRRRLQREYGRAEPRVAEHLRGESERWVGRLGLEPDILAHHENEDAAPIRDPNARTVWQFDIRLDAGRMIAACGCRHHPTPVVASGVDIGRRSGVPLLVQARSSTTPPDHEDADKHQPKPNRGPD